ncbi:hypothetical protein SELMODRAFT_419676 [Selaginella moellendorffii]|uniref:Uncharacterized protein n=1 Tax=Selaginella moellendorffii TaxID=88036 RepID=D8S9P3_SELML|nr:hypothetical protein SELMODRAFT_419676 [Selaginella moellendorffii]
MGRFFGRSSRLLEEEKCLKEQMRRSFSGPDKFFASCPDSSEHEVGLKPAKFAPDQTLWFLREDAVDTACRHSRLPSRNLCPGYGRSGKSPDPILIFESDPPVHMYVIGAVHRQRFVLPKLEEEYSTGGAGVPRTKTFSTPGPRASRALAPTLPSSSRICHVQAPGHLGLSLGQHDDGFSRKLGELVSKQMVGVYVIIWIRKNLCRHVHGLKFCCVGCGILWKQGLHCCQYVAPPDEFCFVCTHLMSGDREDLLEDVEEEEEDGLPFNFNDLDYGSGVDNDNDTLPPSSCSLL